MNKFYFLLILAFLLPTFCATDIAYVVNNPSYPSSNIINAFTEEGYSYTVIGNTQLPSTNFNNYNAIVIDDDVLSNYNYIPVKSKKSLVLNTYYADDWNISEYVGSQASTGYLYGRILIDNSITEGMSTPVQFYSERGGEVYYLPYSNKRAKGLYNLVSTDNYNQYPVIGIINKNGSLYQGGYAGDRIAFFGATNSDYWTSDTNQLFKNTLTWLFLGEDSDGDGFREDLECDDTNAGINPDAEEIPYNGIDEDCSGKDLVDVDGDLFDAEPFGTDCNDDDATVNINSTNIYKNCRNDYPLLDTIPKIIAYESYPVVITANAIDPEDDELTYSINDSRFNQEENVFTWDTEFNDNGTYFYTVSVSDGEYYNFTTVEVEIRNSNRVPLCLDIPDMEWNEDENLILNLSSYCSDEDGDLLLYSFYNTSADAYISLETMDNGLANFSVKKDWFGEDWINFKVSDGLNYTITNDIFLRVLPVNDAPYFSGSIDNVEWGEDSNLSNYLNLSWYFFDVDSDLEYDVSGNESIIIEIINGIASFFSPSDWFGEETVVFSASDEDSTIYSNAVILNVTDENEKPEFGEMNCEDEILEDTEYSCLLNATDFENDELDFSISREYNLDCKVENGNLVYSGYNNHFGNASCRVRVGDAYGYSESLLEVNIISVNDAPELESYSPIGNLTILQDTEKVFSASGDDVEGDVDILWFLNYALVGNGSSYTFKQGQGNYKLESRVYDGELSTSHLWGIFVGNASDFTCSELSGDVCGEKEICSQDFLRVYDTQTCCPVACSERPPAFNDIDKCDIKTSDLIITIEEPDSGENFDIGENITLDLKIENTLNSSLDFNIDYYLYDIEDDEIIEEGQESVSIAKNKVKEISFQLNTKRVQSEENAIFLRVIDEDEDYCNEKYVKIQIERPEHQFFINEMKTDKEEYCLNDFINLDVKLENTGQNDEDITLKIESRKLGIKEEREFELSSEDNEKESFSFSILGNLTEGKYEIKATATSDDKTVSQTKTLTINDCNKIPEEETIILNNLETQVAEANQTTLNTDIEQSKGEEDNNIIYLAAGFIFIIILLTAIIIFFFYGDDILKNA